MNRATTSSLLGLQFATVLADKIFSSLKFIYMLKNDIFICMLKGLSIYYVTLFTSDRPFSKAQNKFSK